MRAAWAVIRREYLQRVRSRWFVIGTIGVPLLFAVAVAIPLFLTSDLTDRPTRRGLVLVDETGVLSDLIGPRLEDAGYELERATGGLDEAGLRLRILDQEIVGYLVVDSATLSSGRALYVAGSAPSTLRRLMVQQSVTQSALELRLSDQDGASSLLSGGDLEVRVVGAEDAGSDVGGPESPSDFGEAPGFVLFGTIILYVATLGYAASVMRSVLEEKSNRVVEVLLSSIEPWELLLGKILGVGAVGLTQLAVWVVLTLLFLTLGLASLVAARPELAEVIAASDALPSPGLLALFFCFFLGGYFIFASFYAAVGALFETEREAGQASMPMAFLIAVPAALLPQVLREPDSTLSVLLSLVPFFSPTLMFARTGLDAAPAWQIALSIALMLATLLGMAWVAGRVYRVGILMTGKRPTVPEIWRWLKEA